MDKWLLLLYTLSFLAELGGVLFVVAEIRESQNQAEAIFKRAVTLFPPAAQARAAALPPTVTVSSKLGLQWKGEGASDLTLELLEKRLSNVEAGVRTDLELGVKQVRQDIDDEYKAVRRFVEDQLKVGTLQRRVLGVGLILTGLFLGLLANILPLLQT